MKLIIDIPENEYRHIKEYYEKNDIVEATYSYIYHGTPLDEVLDKIRDDIEAEMNDLYRQKSIDQRTLTIIHACQRHIAIIDKYTKGESE